MFKRDRLFLLLTITGTLAWLVPSNPARAAETTLSLPEAVALALSNSPELAVERRQIDVAKGELTKARVYPLNPLLEVNPAYGSGKPRDLDKTVGTNAFDIAFSQTLQIRGQWGLRIEKATADLDRTGWTVRDAERRIRGDLTKTFT